MLVSLSEYGAAHGKSSDTVRRMAEKGMLKTAHKIGRNWVVDSDESYPLVKRNKKERSPSAYAEQLSFVSANSNNIYKCIQKRYSNESEIKSNGIVYTPKELATYIAEQMVGSSTSAKKKFTILDPAIGDGELVIALLNALNHRYGNPAVVVVGYETDSSIIAKTKQRIQKHYSNAQVQIENIDFLVASDSINLEFDFIVANPPYIRTQILGASKAQQIALLAGLDGRVDIYYAFLVLAEKFLTMDGIAGFITSNKFLTIKAGNAVRRHLVRNTDILRLTDFGDTKLFNASVLPCVIIFRKKQNPIETIHTTIYESKDSEPQLCTDTIFENLEKSTNFSLPDGRKFSVVVGTLQANADGSPWRINTAIRNTWLEKVEHNTVKRFMDLGKIRVGIKTTADNVFIRESWKDVTDVPELLKPLITHRNAGQVSTDSQAYWQVLYTHTVVNGKKIAYRIEDYPNSYRYLSMHRQQLESRTYIQKANRNWYEIWVPQNPTSWEKRKIVFRDITDIPQFWLDNTGAVVNGDCYWFDLFDSTSDDEILLALAVANSEFIMKYYDIRFNNKLYSGKRRFMSQYVEQFPLPNSKSKEAQAAISLIKEILTTPLLQHQKEKILLDVSELIETLFTR